ncbi:hypothetical protein L596_026090 [Steinernema carpocapsae]|uniref:FAS1 domain-containing protein n=1 Tax=Steinernema carpocapsae TaxID=34508 RepID=A0A4U5M1B1_STECR|nr:hypothetical protein L596_026090 [Steinernema carpocapsae]
MDNPRCTTLMRYINAMGLMLRTYLQPRGAMITFFAPMNEAFERIPEHVERRLLRDPTFREEFLRLHIDRLLYFVKGEWPLNNITYYVIGAGTKATIYQDDVAGRSRC